MDRQQGAGREDGSQGAPVQPQPRPPQGAQQQRGQGQPQQDHPGRSDPGEEADRERGPALQPDDPAEHESGCGGPSEQSGGRCGDLRRLGYAVLSHRVLCAVHAAAPGWTPLPRAGG
ncbi:hypothetical protein [Streptacidiphilus albus]|uniref:hypothetical protein n=1 Tax=Streptacidiphilus albus TaxID=105425 RepID=UPI00068FA4DC|nr:hypothetical protein [Streptacidiphilus albus]